MTELSFLLELLLEHKLQKTVQLRIKDRIKELEERASSVVTPRMAGMTMKEYLPPALAMQSPSTIANMIKDGFSPMGPAVSSALGDAPEQTTTGGAIVSPVAAMAVQSRQEAIRIATSGKEEKGRTSPRKF